MEITPATPYQDLTTIILSVRGVVEAWGVRKLLSDALNLLLFHRLCRISGTMRLLAARFLAGTLRRYESRAVASKSLVAAVAVGGAGVLERVWPGRFGWLVWLAGWKAAGYGSQLRTVLGTPEMVALLTACPQAGRTLRPLCRMLAVETSLLRPWVVGGVLEGSCGAKVMGGASLTHPTTTTTTTTTKKRVRRVAEVIAWRTPFPRGVLAAARRQGFGKVRFEKED